jgi:hypothetical protein
LPAEDTLKSNNHISIFNGDFLKGDFLNTTKERVTELEDFDNIKVEGLGEIVCEE